MKLWYHFTYDIDSECIVTKVLPYRNIITSLKVIKEPDLKGWKPFQHGYYRGGKKSLAR